MPLPAGAGASPKHCAHSQWMESTGADKKKARGPVTRGEGKQGSDRRRPGAPAGRSQEGEGLHMGSWAGGMCPLPFVPQQSEAKPEADQDTNAVSVPAWPGGFRRSGVCPADGLNPPVPWGRGPTLPQAGLPGRCGHGDHLGEPPGSPLVQASEARARVRTTSELALCLALERSLLLPERPSPQGTSTGVQHQQSLTEAQACLPLSFLCRVPQRPAAWGPVGAPGVPALWQVLPASGQELQEGGEPGSRRGEGLRSQVLWPPTPRMRGFRQTRPLTFAFIPLVLPALASEARGYLFLSGTFCVVGFLDEKFTAQISL